MMEVANLIEIDPERSPEDVPIAGIRPSSQILLSKMLNPTRVIPAESGLPRDWRGLGELSGVTSETISYLESREDPLAELLKIWCQSQDSACRFFSDLRAFLAIIDRFDVVEDVGPLLESDAAAYRERLRNGPLRDSSVVALDEALDRNILTIEDSERLHQGLPLTRYDALILHSEDEEDSQFAGQVVEKLETEYGLKLCVKDRDLLPGTMFEHEVIGRLIEERCNRFLVIFSPSFLQSRANHFLLSYAQASALESRVRKIVPVMYKRCELPPSVRYSFCIVYNRSGKLWNFWDKLGQSLKPTSVPGSNPSAGNVRSITNGAVTSTLTDSSVSWWDPQKPKPTKDFPSTPQNPSGKTLKSTESFDSGISNEDFKAQPDTLSLKSEARLIPEGGSNANTNGPKGPKWLKKFIGPSKKKKEKQKALAE